MTPLWSFPQHSRQSPLWWARNFCPFCSVMSDRNFGGYFCNARQCWTMIQSEHLHRLHSSCLPSALVPLCQGGICTTFSLSLADRWTLWLVLLSSTSRRATCHSDLLCRLFVPDIFVDGHVPVMRMSAHAYDRFLKSGIYLLGSYHHMSLRQGVVVLRNMLTVDNFVAFITDWHSTCVVCILPPTMKCINDYVNPGS